MDKRDRKRIGWLTVAWLSMLGVAVYGVEVSAWVLDVLSVGVIGAGQEVFLFIPLVGAFGIGWVWTTGALVVAVGKAVWPSRRSAPRSEERESKKSINR